MKRKLKRFDSLNSKKYLLKQRCSIKFFIRNNTSIIVGAICYPMHMISFKTMTFFLSQNTMNSSSSSDE